ncbi:flagellar basal body P-ring formation chaperone FlgA [Pararobbsia silviterrae]|nr:flagellar basal body P-ring formation chaperone FlgA [Pararobbsia silviterrae]
MAPRNKTIDGTAQRAGWLARVGVLGAALSLPALPLAAFAQEAPGGMIVIPGTAEAAAPNGANPAGGRTGGAAQAAAPANANANANADAEFAAAARGAQIVIPGNGETGAKRAPVNVETVRGAGANTVNATNTTNAGVPSGASPRNASAAPAFDPAAALLANHPDASTQLVDADEPAAPSAAQAAPQPARQPAAPAGAEVARLRAQAAAELSNESAPQAARVNTNAATAQTPRTAVNTAAANQTNTPNAAPAGAPGKLAFDARVNVPTARKMPSLETIEPTQSMGTAMSPAARFAAAADLRHDAAQAASGAAGNAAQASNDDAQRAPALQRVHAAAPQVIVESSNGPPIEHSVTISHAELAVAGAVPVGKQDPAVIMKVAEDFLREQAAGLPGRVTITVPPVGPHGLAACDNLQAFMAPGAPVWGRTTVGVRCVGDRPWTLYVLARISVEATYYVAARQIMPGDVIQATDLLPRDGDLAVMPRAIVTDPSQAVGAVAQNRITPGLPVRTDLIRSVNAIQLGQTVKVVAEGNGFSISTDGSALNNAGPGQQVRVKTDNGQTVVGTATGRGVVQIPM